MREIAHLVPPSAEQLEVVVHVDFELADGFRAECMRDSLALACMLGTIAGVEQTALDRDKCIIVLAGFVSLFAATDLLFVCSPLQEAIAMTIDVWNRIGIGDRDMMWLDPDQLTVLLVCLIDC